MKKLDMRLLRMIKHSKGQFISVVAIVAVALCTFIALSMTYLNVRNAVDYYYDITNFSDIQVQLTRIPQSALKEIQAMDGIKEVQGRISFDVPLRVEDKDEKVSVRILSIPSAENRINKLFFSDSQQSRAEGNNIFLLEQFADARKLKPGDRITPYINGKIQQMKVIGKVNSPEFIYLMENEQALLPVPDKFGIAYVDEALAQSIFGFKGSYNELLITVKDPDKTETIAESLEKKLDEYGVKKIVQRKDQLSNNILTQKLDALGKMSTTLPVMFLMVAAIIISIMLSRVVHNDRIAIGVLKAMGYSSFEVLLHYLKYALAIGLVGSMFGIAIGLWLQTLMTKVYAIYFKIPLLKSDIYYIYFVYAIILTGVFCIASGFMGARPVLGIMPADSMRPEAPKVGKRILLERIGFIWRRLSFSWKMVTRNLLRNKRRFIFLVLGLALAYSINTVPSYMVDATSAIFKVQYGVYQKMDYNLEFSRPMNSNSINELKHIINTSRIEPRLEYPFELQNGWRKKALSVVGIPKDTAFYEFRDSQDNLITLQDNSILVTQAAAKALKVKQGDVVTIKSYIPGKDDISLRVSGVTKQYLGINAYMDIKTMQRLMVDKDMVTGASLDSTDDVKGKLRNVKNIAAVRSLEDIKNSFEEFMDTMVLATRLYLIFGGILGFAIIYNSTVIGISERNMEFASLRIMGFDNRDIYRMITKENLFMAGIAILIGIPLGIGMVKGMAQSYSTDIFTLPAIIEPKAFISAAVATLFFVVIAQLATWKKIYKLNFIDALKSRIS